jgi:hypothetical protein
VIQAVVGLDASRRHQVEELLMRHLRQHETPDEVRETCVRLGTALDVQDSSFKELAAEFIFTVTVRSINRNDLDELSARLKWAFSSLDASRASQAADILVAAMSKTTDGNALSSLSQGLQAVSGHLDASGASKAADILMEAMSKVPPDNSNVYCPLRSVMSTMCERWSTPDLLTLLRHPLVAGEAQRALLDVLGHRTRRTFRNTWHFLDWARSNGVDFVPSRVPPDSLAQEK